MHYALAYICVLLLKWHTLFCHNGNIPASQRMPLEDAAVVFLFLFLSFLLLSSPRLVSSLHLSFLPEMAEEGCKCSQAAWLAAWLEGGQGVG